MSRCLVNPMRILSIAAFLGALFASVGGQELRASSPQVPQCRMWTLSPGTGRLEGEVRGLAAPSADNIWAVGSFQAQTRTTTTRGAFLHWNGKTWTIVPSPSRGSETLLTSLAALSSDDIWAVGTAVFIPSGDAENFQKSLIEHWNGKVWKIVPSPSVRHHTELASVVAISRNDIWAVGRSYVADFDGFPLAEHWNGGRWTLMKLPNPGTGSLASVAVTSNGRLLSVGSYLDANYHYRPLAETWNGTSWARAGVSLPALAKDNDAYLNAVGVTSRGDAWTVGTQSRTPNQALIERQNQGNWTVGEPPPTSKMLLLSGVLALSSSDVWIAGQIGVISKTFVAKWNGTNWSVVPSANAGKILNLLTTVVVVPGQGLVAAGSFETLSGKHTITRPLVEWYKAW